MPFSQVRKLNIAPLEIPAETCITKIFAHYCEQPWAMLLDSSNSDHLDARYDILVAQPVTTLVGKHQQTQIWQQSTDQVQVSKTCPIALLKHFHQVMLSNVVPQTDTHLPFCVGALGYFGYDLARRFEHLPFSHRQNYKSADMAVGIYAWSLIKDKRRKIFYLCWLDGYPAPTPTELETLASKAKMTEEFRLTRPWQGNLSKHGYLQQVSRIKQYLRDGDCYQVNFAQRFDAAYTGNEWCAYLQLRKANQAPFSAFIRTADNLILSVSPERFLKVKDSQVQTKPIKGTRPRFDETAKDTLAMQSLLKSDKDRAENLMIVDLLRNDLSRNCLPGSVQVPELFAIESFAAVHHLVSTICAELKADKSPLELLRDAFPGGSITGAPKIRAMQIIDELEPSARNIYCGSIGYLGYKQDMDTSICIRTLLCEDQRIYCWAGGGIVIDSEPADEYQESLDKVSKILPVLS